jgi:hypothetical protein
MPIVEQLLNPGIVWVFIPLAGIALGGVLALAKLITKHRERMAKIGMGMDPDSPLNPNQPQQESFRQTGTRY